MSYQIISSQHYTHHFSILSAPVNFIASPSIILREDTEKAIIFDLIRIYKEQRSVGAFIKYLEKQTFNHKYLFVLGVVFCITGDEDSERTESDYWKNFQACLFESTAREKILDFVSKFCKRLNIPFFDIYENYNQNNICGRFYSLLPFTKDEIEALAFIYQDAGLNEETDFNYLKEIIVSNYSELFNNLTLGAFDESEQQIISTNQSLDFLPLNYTYYNFFNDYIKRYSSEILKIKLLEYVKLKFREKLEKKKSEKTITISDFELYVKMSKDSTTISEFRAYPKIYIREELAAGIEIRQKKITLLCTPFIKHGENGLSLLDIFDIKYKEKWKAISLTRSTYLLTTNAAANGWLKIEKDFTKKIYNSEVAGYVEITENTLQIEACDFAEVPLAVKQKYKHTRDATVIELVGGLSSQNGKYMWFAIPEIIVHNNTLNNITFKLNETIIHTTQPTLKKRFYQFLENKLRTLEPLPLFKNSDDDELKLSFAIRNVGLGSSIRIERQNYLVPLEENRCEINGEYLPESNLRDTIPHYYMPNERFSYLSKNDYLLLWISRFEKKGVTYERFKDAILSIYFPQQLEIDKQSEFNIPKVVKRLMEQFIGLGFMRAESENGVVKYITNKARFITTHQGELLLTGARSMYQLKKLIEDNNVNFKVNDGNPLTHDIYLPRLFKKNTTEGNKILIEREINNKAGYKTWGCLLDRNNWNANSVVSYPMHLISTYDFSKDSICENFAGEIRSSGGITRFSIETLSFEPVSSLNLVLKGSILEIKQYGIYKRYISGELKNNDGEMALDRYLVYDHKKNDVMYYLKELNLPPSDFGWCYDSQNQILYIPRRINVPDQIREALQCSIGSYTSLCYSKPKVGTFRPEINDKKILIRDDNFRGSIELEKFIGISQKLLKAIELKLNIKTTEIN